MSTQNPAAGFETLFHAAGIDLVIPEYGTLPPEPDTERTDELASWWNQVEQVPTRDVAFLDEKIFYYVALLLPFGPVTGSSTGDSPNPALFTFLSRLQLSMSASFVPPIQPSQRRPPTAGFADSAGLAPPTPNPNFTSGLRSPGDPHAPPVTPNPFPNMKSGEEGYARVEGVTVWEGDVQLVLDDSEDDLSIDAGPSRLRKGKRDVFKTDRGWTGVWRGEVPISYVRTPIQNPLLALTASLTLRGGDFHRSHRKNIGSVDSFQSVQTNGGTDSGNDTANMEEIDLLSGLVGEGAVPASRLAPSIREDLSVQAPTPRSPLMTGELTPRQAPSYSVPTTATSGPSRERAPLPQTLAAPAQTLRKSYRRVLSLSSGLKVRMRNLVLPQLLRPPFDGHEGEGERRVVLCVEIENSLEGGLDGNGFEVEGVDIEITGKGGKATTELVCDPALLSEPTPLGGSGAESKVFPKQLSPIEQYNLLYAVSIATVPEESKGIDEVVAKSLGTGETSRPVSITVHGRPFQSSGNGVSYPTKAFPSRWNCTLDLTQYLSQQPNSAKTPFSPPPVAKGPSRPASLPNAIAGDKRYSLASLMSGHESKRDSLPPPPPPPRPISNRITSISGKPLMPSQLANTPPARVTSLRLPPRGGVENEGLLISVKLLSPTDGGFPNSPDPGFRTPNTPKLDGEGENGINALDTFSIEVFVHNRTDEVRRFKLNIPPAGKFSELGNVLDKRKQAAEDALADDPALRQILSQYLGSAPPILPLENDVRCGPLLPGASLSARMRFMALRNGVHRIEKLRVTGANNEFDFLVAPVMDVVVGKGGDS